MSTTLQSESAASTQRFPLTIVVQALALILTIGASMTAAYYTKGADSTRLTVLENKVEQNDAKHERQLTETREQSLPRGEFNAWRDVYMNSVQKDVAEIKDGIKDIRAELLRDAQNRRR